ncbi:hypothetical protein HU773_007575 [Pseudomonas shahriarae]|uniref:hypothetical protein n=1 Tax=Pseudomonas shahriarae TaxID=2745512 RepID=UPI00164775F8|nr:hypothetical protein [Pseudomonas shahriarae]QXH90725.1 hypothetical protein HU773_007575 [Pseudomonas shahriarae]
MTTVFIAGSISIKGLDAKVKHRIDNIIGQNHSILVGDADGVDTSIQSYLCDANANNAVVYCTGSVPRNNLGRWPVKSIEAGELKPGSRAFFTAKDVAMAEDADFGLMVWDSKSSGTLSNVIELLSRNKKSVVFVNKTKSFQNVGDVVQLEELLTFMSPLALQKVDMKIGLMRKLAQLKNEQIDMFI